jgi:uncharacterized caspase-like protein
MWFRSVITTLALLLASSGDTYASRIALVIGNAAYRHASPLTNTANDSEQMARLLTAAGFEVRRHRDLALADFQQAVREFAARSQNAEQAVVFFAGHGLEISGINYLIPVDARLASDFDVPDEAVSLDRILTAIEPARQLRMVILDACRNNPFVSNMRRTSASRGVGRGLARVEPTTSNTLVAFAAKAGTIAEDGKGQNSPYTAALLKYIALPGLDLRIALGRVRDEVLAATGHRQEPFIFGSLGGSLVTLAEPVASNGNVTNASEGAPDRDAAARRDYELASRVGNAEALRSYVSRYPEGFYADLARAHLAKLDDAKSLAPITPPEKSRVVIPAHLAGRSFTISGTEIRDLVAESAGAPPVVRRQITLQIDHTGGFKSGNRVTLPSGRELMSVRNHGQLNERGARGGWLAEDGRLIGEFVTGGFRWRGTIEPKDKGCIATMSYETIPGQKLIRMTNPHNGRSLQARSVRFEGVSCTARSN